MPEIRDVPTVTKTSPPPPDLDSADNLSDSEVRARARSRSKSPELVRRRSRQIPPVAISKPSNGFLSPPPTGNGSTMGWRTFSRSPSPLGLIPIHKTFRELIHKHEVPRKLLHVSIGFFVIHLYRTGTQPTAITPVLGYVFIPIATADVLRFVSPSFNWLYIRALGALMRESEFSGWNGVIWYLIGTWTALRVFPKDVATLSILLLSWCDTAASTFGRMFGSYTPKIRRGKSLAGSLAAFLVGSMTTAYFYGKLVPSTPTWPDDPASALNFFGRLSLPLVGEVSGGVALSIVSIYTGLVGSISELTDLWGIDDNIVIPIASAAGVWGFFKLFTV